MGEAAKQQQPSTQQAPQPPPKRAPMGSGNVISVRGTEPFSFCPLAPRTLALRDSDRHNAGAPKGHAGEFLVDSADLMPLGVVVQWQDRRFLLPWSAVAHVELAGE